MELGKTANKAAGKARGGLKWLLLWPWRKLSWRGKLVMVPAIVAMAVYGGFAVVELFV